MNIRPIVQRAALADHDMLFKQVYQFAEDAHPIQRQNAARGWLKDQGEEQTASNVRAATLLWSIVSMARVECLILPLLD